MASEVKLTLSFVGKAARPFCQKMPNGWQSEQEISAVSIDSRTIKSGHLFVGIQGDRFDGNAYGAAALEAGASAAILNQLPQDPQQAEKVFLCADPLAAFRALAKAWRVATGACLIGVGGSVGKTSTKDMLTAILKARWPSLTATKGSNNGFVGIPCTLMDLKPQGTGVIEIGIDEKDAMRQHCDVVQPNISVLTAIDAEHLEKLGTIADVAHEEAQLFFATAASGGELIFNDDDPWLAPLKSKFSAKQLTSFSLLPAGEKNPPVGRYGERQLLGQRREGGSVRLWGLGFAGEDLTPPLPGEHMARNFLAAVAAARRFGLEPQEIGAGLKNFVASPGRSQWHLLKQGIWVLGDYYNASPVSMRAAFGLLRERHAAVPATPLWICLGDMLELGPEERALHAGLAPDLRTFPRAHVLLFGERMTALAEALKKESGQLASVQHFSDKKSLADFLIKNLSDPAMVLLKGSRSMRMEEIWEQLRR